MLRKLIKNCVNGVFLALAWPAALLSGFGRAKPIYVFFAQSFATLPGGIGDRLRAGYYCLTLAECHMSARISSERFLPIPRRASASAFTWGATAFWAR